MGRKSKKNISGAEIDAAPMIKNKDESNIYQKIKDFIFTDCLNYTTNKTTLSFKQLIPMIDEMRENFSDEIIYKSAIACKPKIEMALQHSNVKDDNRKAFYIIGVIQRSIGQFYEEEMHAKAERERLDRHIDSGLLLDDYTMVNRKQKVTDLSALFDEESN